MSQNSQENTSVGDSFLIKSKNGLLHSYFPVNVVKILGTPFSQNTSGKQMSSSRDIFHHDDMISRPRVMVSLNFLIYHLFAISQGKFRTSHLSCSIKKCVPKNSAKFTGKHRCQNVFFNKVAGLPATLLKKRL